MKDNSNLFPFGVKFFSMLVSIAYRIGPRGSPRNLQAPLDLDIPFAACIKYAFDNSQTGKVTVLYGDFSSKLANSKWKERAESIKDIAEELIKW